MNFGYELPKPPVYQAISLPDVHCDPVAPVDHPRPVHFYHLHAGATHWLKPARGHFQALHDAEFWGEVHVGLVGTTEQRLTAEAWLDELWPGWIRANEAEHGYEQVTLASLHSYARSLPSNTPVLYCHTKGAWRQGENQELWRQCMQVHCVTRWRDCTGFLDEGYDTVGVHWISEEVLRKEGFSGVGKHYGGNFWWATAGYLAGLPPVTHASRYDAEGWIGKDEPRYADLAPGWIDHKGHVCG